MNKLKGDARRVKREMDELERAAYGITFEELIRLTAGNRPFPESNETNAGGGKHETD